LIRVVENKSVSIRESLSIRENLTILKNIFHISVIIVKNQCYEKIVTIKAYNKSPKRVSIRRENIPKSVSIRENISIRGVSIRAYALY